MSYRRTVQYAVYICAQLPHTCALGYHIVPSANWYDLLNIILSCMYNTYVILLLCMYINALIFMHGVIIFTILFDALILFLRPSRGRHEVNRVFIARTILNSVFQELYLSSHHDYMFIIATIMILLFHIIILYYTSGLDDIATGVFFSQYDFCVLHTLPVFYHHRAPPNYRSLPISHARSTYKTTRNISLVRNILIYTSYTQ